jgi:hypothetical protein
MEINTKVTQVFSMLALPYTNSGVEILDTSILGCPNKMGGLKLALLQDLGQRISYFISYNSLRV